MILFFPSVLILLGAVLSTASAQDTNIHGTICCIGIGVPDVLVSYRHHIVTTDTDVHCRTFKVNPGNNQSDVSSHHIYINCKDRS